MKQKKYPHQKEIEELKAGWQRTQADFDNFRKRIETEKKGWNKLSKMELVLELLPVLDNFERALNLEDHGSASQDQMAGKLSLPKPSLAWLEGVKSIYKQLLDVLKKEGLEEISPKAGERFNPNLHEAVEGHGEKIKEVRLKGYQLGEKVLRPAQVTVKK